MSKWLGALAGNVESLLDKVDQVAGSALQKDAIEDGLIEERPRSGLPQSSTATSSTAPTYTPFLSSSTKASPTSEQSQGHSKDIRSSPSNVLRNADRLSKTAVFVFLFELQYLFELT